MDEKYIKDIYDNLGGESVFGNYNDYYSLITSDDAYAKDIYDNLGGESVFGSYDDFSSLVKKKDELQPTSQEDVTESTTKDETTPTSLEYSVKEPIETDIYDRYNEDDVDFILNVSNPELYNEKKLLEEEASNVPFISKRNNDIQKRIQEINDTVLKEANKRDDAVISEKTWQYINNKKNIDQIDSQIFEIEKKYDDISKRTEYSFEDLTSSDGTLKYLKEERDKYKYYNEPYEKALEEIGKDTGSQYGTKDFFNTILGVFNINVEESDEFFEYNEELKDYIIKNLGDRYGIERAAEGGMSLEDKENILIQSKTEMLSDKYKELEKILNDKDATDEEKIKAQNDFSISIMDLGFDIADGEIKLKPQFKKTLKTKEFQEMAADSPILDWFGTTIGSGVKTGLGYFVGNYAEAQGNFVDLFYDREGYSPADHFLDSFDRFASFNYLPSSKEKGLLIDKDGNFNLSLRGALKGAGESLFFTLGLMMSMRSGKFKMPEGKNLMTKIISSRKNPQKAYENYKLVTEAYRLGLSQSMRDARDIGLRDEKAVIYGNASALMEGVTGLIMPDTKYFSTTAGKVILNNFTKDLKSAANKKAISSAVVSFFENITKEIGEEEAMLLYEDIAKTIAFTDHKFMSEFLDNANQKQLLTVTTALSGILGGINIPSEIKQGKKDIFNEINKNSQLLNIMIEDEINMFPEKKDDLLKVKDFINNVNQAVENSPEDVTFDQIQLLTEKIKVQNEMNSVDDSFKQPYRDKIDEINKKIIEQYAIQEQETRDVPDAQPAEGVSEMEGEVRKPFVTEKKKEKVSDAINRPITLTELGGSKLEQPIEGDLYVEGQQVVVEDSDGNITEIGNVDKISDSTLEDMGIIPKESDVKTDNEGNIVVNNEVLVPDTKGIKRDKRGNISRVVLQSPDGSITRTLRGANAEEAAYQILLKEAQSPEQEQRINELLEQDEEFQNELRKAEAATEAETDTDTKQAAIPGEKAIISGVEITFPTEQEDAQRKEIRTTETYINESVSKLEVEDIDQLSKDLDGDFGFVTGENPLNKALTEEENRELNKKAEQWLKDKGYSPRRVTGKYNQGENSFFVPGLTKADAIAFAKEFNQESVAHSEGMLYQDGRVNPRDKSKDNFTLQDYTPKSNFVSIVKTPDGPKTFEVGYDFDTTIKEKIDEKPKAGNRLFNEPLKAVKEIANRYYERVFGKERPKFEGTRKLDKEFAKRISDAFEEMQNNPNDPEVKAAYEALAKETMDQYQDFIDAGYTVEINNEEPYANSQEMIDDLRENKRIKIFSTESGFGDTPITDRQRRENPLLRDSGVKDINGQTMLINDVFRAIHDFYGHAELGNSFGPKGEENAWQVHARMFSPLARRAMTTETRGQNSYVNFSGVNKKVDALREKARKLREEGRDAQKVVDEIYKLTRFADQKIGLLPEEFSSIEEVDGVSKLRELFSKKATGLEEQAENAREALSEIAPDVEVILHESEQAYAEATGEIGRRQKTGGTYQETVSNGKTRKVIHINPEKANKRTVAHETFHAILLNMVKSDAEVQRLTAAMIRAVYKSAPADLRKLIDDFASSKNTDGSNNYDLSVQNEERLAELIGYLATEYGSLPKPTQGVIKRWLDRLAKMFGLKPFTDNEVIDVLNTIAKNIKTGQVLDDGNLGFFDKFSEPGSKISISNRNHITDKSIKESAIPSIKINAKNIDPSYDKDINIPDPKTMQEVLDKSGGMAVFINSDGTKVGTRENGESLDGGWKYTYIEKNSKDNIGFAATSSTHVKNLYKLVSRLTQERDIKDPKQKGKPIAVFITVQGPETMLGEWYGGEFFMEGIDKALEQKKIKGGVRSFRKLFRSAVKKAFNLDGKNKELSAKQIQAFNLLEMVNSKQFESHDGRIAISKKFASKEFSFGFRVELMKTLIPNKKALGSNREIKQALLDVGMGRQDFYREHMDESLLEVFESEGFNEKDTVTKGIVMGGYFMDPYVSLKDFYDNRVNGIKHAQFNESFSSNGETFLLDNAHNINKLDPYMGYLSDFGYEMYNRDKGTDFKKSDDISIEETFKINKYLQDTYGSKITDSNKKKLLEYLRSKRSTNRSYYEDLIKKVVKSKRPISLVIEPFTSVGGSTYTASSQEVETIKRKQVSGRPSISEVRKAAKENGISEADTNAYLKELGYTDQEIASETSSAKSIEELVKEAAKEDDNKDTLLNRINNFISGGRERFFGFVNKKISDVINEVEGIESRMAELSISSKETVRKYIKQRDKAIKIYAKKNNLSNEDARVEIDRMVNNLMSPSDNNTTGKDAFDELNKVNKKLASIVIGMRSNMDSMSKLIMNDPSFKNIPESTRKKIAENLGNYIHETYLFFVDKNFKPTEAMKAEAYLAKANEILSKEPNLTTEEAVQKAKEYIDSLLSSWEESRSPNMVVKNLKISQASVKVDADALKARTKKPSDIDLWKRIMAEAKKKYPKYKSNDKRLLAFAVEAYEEAGGMFTPLPQYLKNLLGQVKEPSSRYINTMLAQGNLIYKNQAFKRLADTYIGEFIMTEKPTKKSQDFVQVDDKMSPLHNLWVHKSIVKEIESEPIYKTDHKLLEVYYKALNAVRRAKILPSSPTWIKNIVGGYSSQTMNGMFSAFTDPVLSAQATAGRTAMMTFNKRTEFTKEIWKEASKAGVLATGVEISTLGYIDDMYRHLETGDNKKAVKSAKKLWKKTKDGAKNLERKTGQRYAQIDDYTKAVMVYKFKYDMALKMYGREYNSLNDSEKEMVLRRTGNEVKTGTPTWSRLPSWFKNVARVPVGDFVSFRVEAIRSFFGAVGLAVSDARAAVSGVDSNGNVLNDIQKKAYAKTAGSRMIGIASNIAMHTVVSSFIHLIYKFAFGDDEDEIEMKEQVVKLRPEWTDDNIIVTKVKDDGTVVFFDYSGWNQYADVLSIMGGNTEPLTDSFDVNMLVKYVKEAYDGEKDYGDRIWSEEDNGIVKVMKSLGHISYEGFMPSIPKSFAYQYSKRKKNDENWGSIGDVTSLAAGLSTIRTYEYNIYKNASSYVYKINSDGYSPQLGKGKSENDVIYRLENLRQLRDKINVVHNHYGSTDNKGADENMAKLNRSINYWKNFTDQERYLIYSDESEFNEAMKSIIDNIDEYIGE